MAKNPFAPPGILPRRRIRRGERNSAMRCCMSHSPPSSVREGSGENGQVSPSGHDVGSAAEDSDALSIKTRSVPEGARKPGTRAPIAVRRGVIGRSR